MAAGGVVAAPRPAETVAAPVAATDSGEFIFQSVLTGLADDGVPRELAKALAQAQDDFVSKCRICGMTRKALFAYSELQNAPAAKDGKGLPENLAKRLKSDKTETRHAALRELTQRYIEQGFAKLAPTPEQKDAMKKELEQLRKVAMGALPAGQKYCPSCDGATCRIPKL
jgi:hypothetical protein